MKQLSFVFALIMISGLQQAAGQDLDSLMASYDKKVPQEKLYLHFDNNSYTPGQTVWYKAYLLNNIELSQVSRNLYIDWFDETGRMLKRTVAPVISGTAFGDFTIPQTFTGGRLQVMAYTKWMLNFDSSLLFHQTLRVIQQTTPASRPAVMPVTTLHFFPEGGDLVENINSHIAFRALNSEGMPVSVSGRILNSSKQEVVRFATDHDGMGKVPLTPAANESYTAEWTDPQGIARSTPLPAAKKAGVVLTVVDVTTARHFSIERQPNADDRFKKILIVGTMDQQVIYKAKANLTEKTRIMASLPTASLSSGVLQLTLFDDNMQPLAERILFINNEEYHLHGDIRTDTLNFEKRGKNVYEIELEDTVPATLSLSVTEGENPNDSTRNILSELLLSSEIRGHIHNPAYYFSSGEDSVAKHLDLVMLTNGWRRFAWSDVLANKTPALKYSRDTTYLSIAGKIDKLSESKIKKAETVNLILLAKDSSRQFLFAPLQPDGSFSENNLILFDTAKVYYALNKTFIPGRSHVAINNTFLPFNPAALNRPLNNYLADTTGTARIKALVLEQRRLDSLMKATTLQEVIVRTKVKSRIEELNEKYTSGLFETGVSRDFDVVSDKAAVAYPTTLAYLEGKVAGLMIRNATGPEPVITRRNSPVALFIDEMRADAGRVNDLPFNSVAYIKVFDPPFFGASGGGPGGAIAIYTKKGDEARDMLPGLDYTLLPGYTPFKQFYSPDYAEKQLNFSQADLRRTIYWKPNLITDGSSKKLKVSFYNNDISHSFHVVIEGVSVDGKILHIDKFLK